MRKNLIALAVLLLSSWQVFAQYDVVRKVQDTSEMRVFSEKKIRMERIIWQSDTGLVMYKGKAFNPKGQLTLSREYYTRLYLQYDPTGKMIIYMDSAYNDDNTFEVIKYGFNYDNKGRLTDVITNDGRSTIVYSEDGSKGVETFITFDKDTSERYYLYDPAGNLILSEFYDSDKRLYYKERNFINKEGLLSIRHRIKYLADGGHDSTITYFIYKDGRLSSERSHITRLYYVAQDGGLEPTHSAEQEYGETTKYFYDKEGRLLGKEYTHDKSELDYSYLSWTYDERGLVIKHSEKYGTGEPMFFIHDYVYY